MGSLFAVLHVSQGHVERRIKVILNHERQMNIFFICGSACIAANMSNSGFKAGQ